MSINIVGKRFGMLTVIDKDNSFKDPKRTKWICLCDCGNQKSIYRDSLISGRTKSCGCQMHKGTKGINSTHNMSKTRIYHEWSSMRGRCKPSSQDANIYHDRGITVCKEWNSDFCAFYDWAMRNGYSDDLSIDRIDNDLGYCPSNCRWVTIEEQQSNKTNNLKVEYGGKEYCLRTLCAIIGFPYKTAYRRYKKMFSKFGTVDTVKLFAPIQSDKIAIKFRKKE